MNDEIKSLDLLSEVDLSNVDTARPLLPDKTVCRVRILKLTVVDSKKGPFKNMEVVLGFVDPMTTTLGKPLSPNYTHTEVITLKQTEKYDPRENLARLQECFLGTKGKWDTASMIGQEGTVRFRLEQERKDPETGDTYPEGNKVAVWIKKNASAAGGVTLG